MTPTQFTTEKIQEKIKEFEKEIIQEFEQALKQNYVPMIKFENKWKGVFTNGSEYWSIQEKIISVGNNNLTVELYKNTLKITINNNEIKFELDELQEELEKLEKIEEELENKIDDMYWQYLLKLVQKNIDPNATIQNDDWESWIEFIKDNKVYRFYPKIDENKFDSAGIHYSTIIYPKITLNDIMENAIQIYKVEWYIYGKHVEGKEAVIEELRKIGIPEEEIQKTIEKVEQEIREKKYLTIEITKPEKERLLIYSRIGEDIDYDYYIINPENIEAEEAANDESPTSATYSIIVRAKKPTVVIQFNNLIEPVLKIIPLVP